MKKISKKHILILGLTILIVIITGSFLFKNNSAKDAKIVASLESKVLPYVQENIITFYFNRNWCKGLQYNSRSVVEISSSSNNSPCVASATTFSDSDRLVFNEISQRLNSVAEEKFRQIDTEYPISYRPEQANIPHESIGTAFHIDCSFCRTRYVYWPHYTQLPPNIEVEIKYIPINESWYKVEQDWN